jgi:uncharacterized protein
MALLEKQLYVKKSGIPNAGQGLFTKKFIPRGTLIVEYKGRRSTWKEVKDEDGKNGYIFFINRNNVIDGLPYKKALARYANDARGLVRVKGLLNNADYIVQGDRAYIESKKDIPAGSEIFVDYGKDYWKVIRFNIKLWKQEAREDAKNGKATKQASGSRKVKTRRKTAKRVDTHK